MSELLTRAGALFLAPATAARPRAAAAPPPADLVAVLAPAEVLPSVAGGVAAALRRAHRSRAALVLLPEAMAVGRPAFPAAQALARRLSGRGLCATAAGATARVAAAPEDVWRAVSAAAGTPAVLGLSARSDAYDAFLDDADQLLLAPLGEAALTELALASLGPRAELITPPSGVIGRRLAALGLVRALPQSLEVPA